MLFKGIYNKDRESIISFYQLTYQGLKAFVMFQVLSHFERCPGFDKKRYVKKIAGDVTYSIMSFDLVFSIAIVNALD